VEPRALPEVSVPELESQQNHPDYSQSDREPGREFTFPQQLVAGGDHPKMHRSDDEVASASEGYQIEELISRREIQSFTPLCKVGAPGRKLLRVANGSVEVGALCTGVARTLVHASTIRALPADRSDFLVRER
jgi:hypothetical protein